MSEINEKEIKRRFEAISQYELNPEAVARDLQRTRKSLAERIGEQQTKERKIWRIIMKSKITKLAAAAVIVIIVATVIHYLDSSGNSVVWAEVLKNTERVQAFTYRERETRTKEDGIPESEREKKGYFSSKYGLRLDSYRDGQVVISTFTLPAEKALIGIVHPMKAYTRNSLPENEITGLQQVEVGPKYMVKLYMSVEYKKLGRKKINGIEAEGIEVRDPSVVRTNVTIKSFVGRLWVNIETGYPVLFELGTVGDHNSPIEIKTIVDNFQWNIELDESVFDPNIPPDYNLMER